MSLEGELEGRHLPVADVVGVEVAKGVKGLFHDGGCLGLCQVLLLCDVEEKLSSFA